MGWKCGLKECLAFIIDSNTLMSYELQLLSYRGSLTRAPTRVLHIIYDIVAVCGGATWTVWDRSEAPAGDLWLNYLCECLPLYVPSRSYLRAVLCMRFTPHHLFA